ncbi:MAG: GNAT family N-acetyltransferase [Candidatus Nanoarchaeia archaeon]|nr:GNAT family N-acetyltransferase [Candidatus Nanoarchaeia archaeon]
MKLESFMFNDACSRCFSHCCKTDFFEDDYVIKGAIKNRKKMLVPLRLIADSGIDVSGFVHALFTGDFELSKNEFNKIKSKQHRKIMDMALSEINKRIKCLFYDDAKKYCTIHPSVIGEDIRGKFGGVCGRVYCAGDKGYTVRYFIKHSKPSAGVFDILSSDAKGFFALDSDSNEQIGFISYINKGSEMEVVGLSVADEHKNKSIEENLLCVLESRAKDTGCERIVSELGIDCFEKLGYVKNRDSSEKNLEYLCPDTFDGQ